MSIELNSHSAFSKFGNHDGDLVDDFEFNFFGERNFDLKGVYHKDVLVELVKSFLLPMIIFQVKLQTFNSHHNPVRLNSEDYDLVMSLPSVVVQVPYDAVQKVIDKLQESKDEQTSSKQ